MMRLDIKKHWIQIVKRLPLKSGIMPPTLIVAAAVMSVVAAHSAKSFIGNIYSVASVKAVKSVELKRIPLSPIEYQGYLTTMKRLSPVVRFDAGKRGENIEVTINSAEHFSEFMYALASLQSFTESVLWEAQELCIATCEGAAVKAVIRGYKQQFSLN